ncbi:MAG TPA: hypothetical protein VIL74_21310 [Pyrinomonadaceae bacterium]|jgi:hypothetical protein
MKIKFVAFLLIGIFVFTSLTAFGADARIENNNFATPAKIAESNALFMNYNLNMEYCSVELADPYSNLNVRTWEGRVVGKLRHGASVWVSEYSGEWARVSVRRGRRWVAIGWVDSTYLTC